MKQGKTANNLSYALSLIIAAILVLLPFHAWFTTWAGANAGHLDLIRIWKEIIIVAMLPAGLWLVWRSPAIKRWFFGSWIVRLFGLYVLLHAALGGYALAAGQVNKTALIYALIINLRFIYFFILCAVVAAGCDFLRRHWVSILLYPAAAVVVLGLFQRFMLPVDWLKHFGYGPNTVLPYQTVDNNPAYPRLQSTLRGANPLGAYLVLIVVSTVRFLRKNRILLGGLLVLSLIVLFYSYSRSAWGGAAIALVALAGLRFGRRLDKRVGFAVAILVIAAGLTFYFLRHNQSVDDALLHTSSNSTSAQSSNEVRNAALKSGASDIKNQPLGRGPGTAGPASRRNDHPTRNPEDYYLQIGQETGVLGMALFVSIVILVGRELWGRRRNDLAMILLASLIGISAINLVLPAWTDDTLSLLWWGLAGIACAPVIINTKHKQKNGKKIPAPA